MKIRSKQLGRSRVWILGKGPTVVVVHGGPGFSHDYLVRPLAPLASRFRLVFYDQRTHGAVSPESLTRQLKQIVEAAGREGPPFILAHSWGTYLAFAYLTSANRPDVRAALLVSPVPLTLAGYNRAGARFNRLLPKPVPTGIAQLFPYYLAKQNRQRTDIPVPRFDAAVYGRVTRALQRSSYDFRNALRLLPARTHLVFGRQDQLSRAADFTGMSRRVAITDIPGAAHFAFAEQPERFKRVVFETFE